MNRTYFLGQVEHSFYIIISFQSEQEADDRIYAIFNDFRKNIRLHHVFQKLVRE